MADKKISGLVETTSVSMTDVFPIVQGTTTKKITIGTLFGNIPGDIVYSGAVTYALAPEVVSSGAISTTIPISFLVNQTGDNVTLTLNGGDLNLEKTLIATDLTTNPVIVTLNGAGFTSLTFNATNATAKIIYTNDTWYILSLNNVTAA